jgi:outer membrane protein TolC
LRTGRRLPPVNLLLLSLIGLALLALSGGPGRAAPPAPSPAPPPSAAASPSPSPSPSSPPPTGRHAAVPSSLEGLGDVREILKSSFSEASTPGKAGGRKLDLAELWSLAERQFPGLLAGRESVRSARYTHDEQRWLKLPSGELNGYLSWSPNIKCKTAQELGYSSDLDMLGNPLGGPNNCRETNTIQTLNTSTIQNYLPIYGVLLRLDVRIIQPLFTFGKLNAASDLGKVGVSLAQAQTDGQRLDHAVNLVRAYFGLKTARAAYETVKEGQTEMGKWVKQIDRDLESGKGSYTEIDLMRLKVAESQIELGVVDVERTMASALAALRYLVQDAGVDVDDGDLTVWQDERQPLSYYLDTALRLRPELRALRATGEGARLFRRLRVAELLPDFGVIVNIGYGLASGVEDPNHAFMNRMNYVGAGIGLGMRWALDFGPRVARLQKAIADVNVFEARKRELLGGGALEIERAYNDLVEAQRRLKANEAAERRARGWLQGIRQNIDVGTSESRDMIDALRTYFDQHINVLRAINDVNVQAATLRRLCGLEVIPK